MCANCWSIARVRVVDGRAVKHRRVGHRREAFDGRRRVAAEVVRAADDPSNFMLATCAEGSPIQWPASHRGARLASESGRWREAGTASSPAGGAAQVGLGRGVGVELGGAEGCRAERHDRLGPGGGESKFEVAGDVLWGQRSVGDECGGLRVDVVAGLGGAVQADCSAGQLASPARSATRLSASTAQRCVAGIGAGEAGGTVESPVPVVPDAGTGRRSARCRFAAALGSADQTVGASNSSSIPVACETRVLGGVLKLRHEENSQPMTVARTA